MTFGIRAGAYSKPSRWRLWLSALREFPYLIAGTVGDDEDPAFLRRLQVALFASFAVALWVLAWALR